MMKFELIAPCHFGLEAVLKKEIIDLGYDITESVDGRITFAGDADAVCRANICLRTAERILIKVGSFHAETFEDLYQGVKALPWEEFIPERGKFWVKKASSVKSKLFSPSDIQSIVKKAIVERMKQSYHTDWFKEDAESYPIRVFLMKDEVTVALDTTGDSLHKRGYRVSPVIAPISETLAAALIMLTPWRAGRILVDPFCGSGTFPIEAAMIAQNIAPGMKRKFLAETWDGILDGKEFTDARAEARAAVKKEFDSDIQGYDIDPKAIRACRENAEAAGVGGLIHFQRREVKELHHPKKYGFIITNPPYGERIEDRENLPALYGELGKAYENLDSWSMYVITAYDEAEAAIGRKASKNRKIYNGMMKTYFYEYAGPKPPKSGGRRL